MVIDRKFRILAVNPCKANSVYTEDDGIFFCAHDTALPAALEAYKHECIRFKCGKEHIESIELLQKRVDDYQLHNCKVPDTDTDCEIDRCIGGVGT